MNILMVAAEMAPLVKVGGLADVVGALPSALVRRGHAVTVVLPRYGDLAVADLAPWPGCRAVPLRLGHHMTRVRYLTWPQAPTAVRVVLVDAPEWFDRPGIYAHPDGVPFSDTLERSAVLAQAALMIPELADWPVDVVHAHDVQAALTPILRRQWYGERGLPGPGRTVFTIHNLAHQDIVAASDLARIDLPHALAVYPGPLEFFGRANLLKGALLASDLVTTVSPTYAREVKADPVYGCGLEGVLASLGDRFLGILNGVDQETWNPATDPHLPARFDRDDLAGKQICRRALQEELGLVEGDGPLLGLVGRLVPQKGLDLVTDVLDRLLEIGCSLAVLGTGDPRYHELLDAATARHPGRVAFRAGFSEELAHRIYAGSDLFLVPSRFEPCGLSQLYALRYGTPPVVRATGGLADTVRDASGTQGTGFMFNQDAPEAFWAALTRARALFADARAWRDLQRRGMDCDFSWDAAAERYEDCYRSLVADAPLRDEEPHD
ncbi:MAG: glycogen synthase GlgA [Candidatus Krumholzibacteriia bacterium]